MKDLELIKASLCDDISKRKKMTIPKDEKFGLEIEMEEVNYDENERLMHNIDKRFKCYDDMSLEDNGFEIATPVMYNRKEDLQILKKISKTIKYLNPKFPRSSFQVNFNDTYKEKERLDFVKAYSYYEDIIYHFSKGYDDLIRISAKIYARPIFHELILKYGDNPDEECINMLKKTKLYGINFKDNGLIEFRTPNGTDEYELWLNYISTFYYLKQAIKTKKIDMQKVDYYFNKYYNNPKIDLIERDTPCNIKKSIEFANSIFKHEEDKLYFYKQYFNSDKEKVLTYIKNK